MSISKGTVRQGNINYERYIRDIYSLNHIYIYSLGYILYKFSMRSSYIPPLIYKPESLHTSWLPKKVKKLT